jgi:hypothetical protein
MQDDELHSDALLDELDAFLIEHPEYQGNYAELVARLSYMTGMQMAALGLMEAAAHYLDIGARWAPESWSVRLNHAVALQFSGRLREALAEYLHALADSEVDATPMVTVLAARCCRELGEWQLGADLLRTMVPLAPREVAFWDFLDEMETKAADKNALPPGPGRVVPPDIVNFEQGLIQRETRMQEQVGLPTRVQLVRPLPEVDTGQVKDRFCISCGASLPNGAHFCTVCGKPVVVPEANLHCSNCGRAVHPPDKFCRSCGHRLS